MTFQVQFTRAAKENLERLFDFIIFGANVSNPSAWIMTLAWR